MIIYCTDKNEVDLQTPIYLSPKQKQIFIDGMKKIFENEVEVKEIVENKKELDNVKRDAKKFDLNSLSVLADANLNNKDAAKKLNKSEFAVQMKRGNYLKELFEFAKKKGKLSDKEINEFIKWRKNE